MPTPYRSRNALALCFVAAVLLVAGCRALEFPQPTQGAAGDWTLEGASPGRGNTLATDLTFPLAQAWKYNATAAFGPGSALIIGDMVLAANLKGEVHGVHRENGKRIGIKSFGDAIAGAPAAHAGVLYVPVALGKQSIIAYDLASGRTLWTSKGAAVEAGLLFHGGRLLSVDVDGAAQSRDAATGAEQWRYESGRNTVVRASPLLTEQGLFVYADDAGHVTALRVETGEPVWSVDVGAPVQGTPASAGGRIFAPTSRGALVALDAADGAEAWRFSLPDTTVRMAPPAADARQVAFGASDGALRLADAATGQIAWTFQVDEVLPSPPLMSPGALLVGGMGEALYGLDRLTGRLVWRGEVDGRIKSALAAGDGGVVVLAEPNAVYYFKPSDSTYAQQR